MRCSEIQHDHSDKHGDGLLQARGSRGIAVAEHAEAARLGKGREHHEDTVCGTLARSLVWAVHVNSPLFATIYFLEITGKLRIPENTRPKICHSVDEMNLAVIGT